MGLKPRLVLGLLIVPVAWVGQSSAADPPRVNIVAGKEQIDFFVGKDLVTRYHVGPGVAKPYFWPLNGPGGIPLTRAWPMEKGLPGESTDHEHHKSAWFSHGDVIPEGLVLREKIKGIAGADFWSEARGHGRIVCVGVGEPELAEGHGQIVTRNEWRAADGTKILDETRVIQLDDLGMDTRLLVLDIDLFASVATITFGDTDEGSMGIRVADAIRERGAAGATPGRVENAEGRTGAKNCWGYPSVWCDYSGRIAGRAVGVAILADSANPYPSCWQVRDYGLMGANPFGREHSEYPAMKGRTDLVRLPKGEHLRFRYGILLHPGDAKEGRVAEHFRRFSKVQRLVADHYDRRTIYHSPQTPGYTCWVGAWIMPDDSLMVSFTQATGPLQGRPRGAPEDLEKLGITALVKQDPNWDFTGLDLRNVYLRSEDGGVSWTEAGSDPFRTPTGQMSQGGVQIALRDQTILRAFFGVHLPLDDVPRTALLQRSSDGARTWGEPLPLLDPAKDTCRATRLRRLRDGRIIALGGLARGVSAGSLTETALIAAMEPLLLVSEDDGKTWNGPIDVATPEHRKGWSDEEWDAAELPDGGLLGVFRRTDPRNAQREVRWQALLEKRDKSWVTAKIGPAVFPHSGHPDLLATREGVILHVATSGIHWTDDAGNSWHPLDFPGLRLPYHSNYYPHAVQTKDGRILVFAHQGVHDPYGRRDQSITMDSFRLARP